VSSKRGKRKIDASRGILLKGGEEKKVKERNTKQNTTMLKGDESNTSLLHSYEKIVNLSEKGRNGGSRPE